MFDRARDDLGAVLGAELRQPLGAHPRTADLRAQIAEHHVGNAAVVADDRFDGVVDAGAGLKANRRQQQAVVKNLARGGARRSRHDAADIGFVGDADTEPDQRAVVERRRDRDHVGRMGIAGLIRIVDDEAVAGVQPPHVALLHLAHRLLVGEQMVLQPAADDDHASVAVGQPGGAVLRFAQDRRIAAVVERVLHRRGDLAQAAADDLGGDRIDGHHC